jgi:hypothetical protein
MNSKIYTIVEEKNEIDDHLLDIIGNEFKFDHQKGLSEWIKNSIAAYVRSNTPIEQQTIFLRFTDSENNNAVMECIDFVGMNSEQIINAFKRWGDPKAAQYGYTQSKRVPGGHGNGGKFYMRQMFKGSDFITYKNGKLCIYGFIYGSGPNKKYGFANGYKDVSMTPEEAIKFAGIQDLPIPNALKEMILSSKTGFTVVRGISPLGMVNKIQANKICEKLRNYPQVRRHLERVTSFVIHNGKILGRLIPDKLEPKQGFEEPVELVIPERLSYLDGGEEHEIIFNNNKYPAGKLILKTSAEALERGGRFGDLNRIEIYADNEPVAAYYMHEFGVSMYPQSVFIYGDCECPILEDPDDDCVKNDRSKLIAENPKTIALLQWIGERVNELAEKILDEEKKEQDKLRKEHSKSYNDLLNRWSARFMNKIRAELLVGPGIGEGTGFGAGGSSGGSSGGGEKPHAASNGSGQGTNEGGGNTPKKKPRNPRVLLSGIDIDPFSSTGEKLTLDPRQGIIYQRLQDVSEGIYWINTSSPLASAVLKRFTDKSQQWRSYLFQRHVDILLKEAIRNLFKRDSDQFNPDLIDADIFGKFLLEIHEAASEDLEQFLLDNAYESDEHTTNGI